MDLANQRDIDSPRPFIDVWLKVAIVCIVICELFYRLSWTEVDPDLWGHVLFGQDVLRTGLIVQTDPYSYLTAGEKWINHEWLTETIFGFLFNQFGAAGLVGLKLAISAAVLWLLYSYLAQSGFKMLHAFIVLAFTVVLMLSGLQTIRPQLFTYLCFTLVLIVLRKADQQKYAYLFFLPPIFALWVNMHGGFLAGLTLCFVWAAGHLLLQFWSKTFKKSVLFVTTGALLLSVAALLFNPYNTELLTFLLRTATVARPEISEWGPVKINTLEGMAYIAALAVSICSLFLSKTKMSLPLLLMWLIMAVAPLIASRHLPLFAIATVILLAEQIGSWWLAHDFMFSEERLRTFSVPFKILMIALSVGFSIFFLAKAIPKWSLIPVPKSYPIQVVQLLKKVDARGNIANDFNVGEYLIYWLGPRYKVSLDGRRETVYSDKIYLENLAFQDGVADWNALITKYPTDLVLAGKGKPVFNLMKLEPGWLLTYEDSYYGLFARQGTKVAGQLIALPKTTSAAEDAYFP